MPVVLPSGSPNGSMILTGMSSSLMVSSGPTTYTAEPTISNQFVRLPVEVAVGTPRVNNATMPAAAIIGAPIIRARFKQIAGAVPIQYESEGDDRENIVACEYTNPVFGTEGETEPSYTNDFSSFLIDFSAYRATQTTKNKIKVPPELVFKLQKYSASTGWSAVATFSGNNYGQSYKLGSIPGLPTYGGYAVNWGIVLANHGVGCYRIRATQSNLPDGQDGFISESFTLLPFSAERAKGTCKFEFWLSGKIADIKTDFLLYDMTGMWWYDSVRVGGFFGGEKIAEYRQVNLEWGDPYNGKIERVRDEAVQQYEFQSHGLPKYIHERLSVYCLMANKLLVSDYNVFNSDYNIKRLSVIKEGAYEPEYWDDRRRRLGMVTMQFRRGVQGVIKTNC